MPMSMAEKTRENRLRRHARRLGLRVENSRVRLFHLNDRGLGRLADGRNRVVDGDRHDLTLDWLEKVLIEVEERQRTASGLLRRAGAE